MGITRNGAWYGTSNRLGKRYNADYETILDCLTRQPLDTESVVRLFNEMDEIHRSIAEGLSEKLGAELLPPQENVTNVVGNTTEDKVSFPMSATRKRNTIFVAIVSSSAVITALIRMMIGG